MKDKKLRAQRRNTSRTFEEEGEDVDGEYSVQSQREVRMRNGYINQGGMARGQGRVYEQGPYEVPVQDNWRMEQRRHLRVKPNNMRDNNNYSSVRSSQRDNSENYSIRSYDSESDNEEIQDQSGFPGSPNQQVQV